MSAGSMMQAESYALLRHVEVHGPRSRAEMASGLGRQASDLTKTLNNLVSLGYFAKDETTTPINFTLTNKARVKLSSPYAPKAPSTKARKPREVKERIGKPKVAPRIASHAWAPPKRTGQAMATPYSASEYQPSNRPGAMAAFSLPSRVGDRLHYRDGHVTDMAGNPLSIF